MFQRVGTCESWFRVGAFLIRRAVGLLIIPLLASWHNLTQVQDEERRHLGRELRLTVSDKGRGIPADILQAFKGHGGRLGVGLAGCGSARGNWEAVWKPLPRPKAPRSP